MKLKEPTYQVALDALALTTCYPAFLITAEKRFSVNVEVFREILNICPKVPGKAFDEPPTEEEALSFIRKLGHTGDIKYITDVIVDHLHQLWRTFASIINNYLCGNVSSLDKIRLSRVQILWGMYYKKNLDSVALIWEDMAYQIDKIDSKKQDKMFYPRFTKIIIHHFFTKDKSISMRNRMFMHTARDDSVLGTIRFVPIHAETQVYGAIIPKAMMNQALLDFIAYKTYYAIFSGAEPPKSRKSQKKSDSAISYKESPSKKKSAKAKKVTATKPKPTKKKAPIKADRGKGLNVLSDVALSEVAHLKEATKRSKKDFRISQASGSGDGTDFESGVPDEQHLKTSSTDEGTEEDDDENDSEDESDNGDNNDDDDANDDDNQEDDDTNDDDEETDSDRTESDRIKIPVLNQSSTEYYEKEKEKFDDEEKIDDKEKMDEEEDDEVTKDLYKDVNEDAHVTLTPVLDTQKTDEPVQSSSVSFDFTSKLLNLENPYLADNEIASLMDTTARHKRHYNLISFTSGFLIVDRYIDNKLREAIQKAIIAHNFDCREEAQDEKRDYIELIDTSIRTILKEEVNTQLPQILPQAVLDFATHVIEKNVTESLEASVLARSSSQLKSTYEAAASLFEFDLTKILIYKMEKNMSYDKADYKRELYDALVKSYQNDKDLFDTYGEVFTLKRNSRSKEKKSSSTSKDASQSQHRLFGKSAHVEEPSYTVDDSGVQQDQEFDMSNNDKQPANKEVSKANWFKKPERPPTPDSDWNKRQHVHSRPPQTWISQVAHAKEPRTSFDELMDTTFDFSAFVLNRLNIKDLTQEILVGPAFELLKGTCKSLTELEYHLKEYHRGRQVIPQDIFINNDLEYLKGGDLSRRYSTSVMKTKADTYEIKWIEDLVRNLWSPVKVIYDKHAYWGTSHWGPKRQHFYGFAANMSSSKDVYSRKRIIAITRLTIMKKYDYGHLEEIEVRRDDQKLYKFREGDFPRLRLQDIEDMLLLLVQQKLTNLTIDEQYDLNVALRMFTRRIVIQRQDIDKQLYERRLMWNLEKFVSGREYGNDLRLLEQTI
ncbi:hypothetical protein Tco_0178965 [Tanacetum coccineum]